MSRKHIRSLDSLPFGLLARAWRREQLVVRLPEAAQDGQVLAGLHLSTGRPAWRLGDSLQAAGSPVEELLKTAPQATAFDAELEEPPARGAKPSSFECHEPRWPSTELYVVDQRAEHEALQAELLARWLLPFLRSSVIALEHRKALVPGLIHDRSVVGAMLLGFGDKQRATNDRRFRAPRSRRLLRPA